MLLLWLISVPIGLVRKKRPWGKAGAFRAYFIQTGCQIQGLEKRSLLPSLPWHLRFACFISLDSHAASTLGCIRKTLLGFSSLSLLPCFLLIVILRLLPVSDCQYTQVEKNTLQWGFQSGGFVNFPCSGYASRSLHSAHGQQRSI